MSGKASRDKGLRNERLLRDHLIELGYTARRVPLSGAQSGYPGDVVAEKDGKTHLFELKTRKRTFKTLYPVSGLSTSCGGVCVAISTNLAFVQGANLFGAYPVENPKGKFSRIVKMWDAWCKGCDYLVVKDDHKPFLFIRVIK